MQYNIPVSKADKLRKMVAKFNKKGANLHYAEIGETVIDGTMFYWAEDLNGRKFRRECPCKVKCLVVEADGSYIIDGWEFVGTIEFLDAGNVIRLASSKFDGKVPERFRTSENVCEHCHTIRNRKDLYIIHNVETDEYRQVGKQCLLEYTRGMDANVCASIMEEMAKFVELQDYGVEYDEFMGNGFGASGYGCSSNAVKKHAYALVKEFGYMRGTTVDDLVSFLYNIDVEKSKKRQFEALTLPTDEEIAEIDSYVETMPTDSDYFKNAKVVWQSQYLETRDFALVASFIGVYLRKIVERKAADSKKSSQWVGEVGERITIKAKSVRVLYTKDSYTYNGPLTFVQEIVGEDGNVYVWSTTNNLSDMEGDFTLVATVKSHGEYRGVKQTVVTRGRVTE